MSETELIWLTGFFTILYFYDFMCNTSFKQLCKHMSTATVKLIIV